MYCDNGDADADDAAKNHLIVKQNTKILALLCVHFYQIKGPSFNYSNFML